MRSNSVKSTLRYALLLCGVALVDGPASAGPPVPPKDEDFQRLVRSTLRGTPLVVARWWSADLDGNGKPDRTAIACELTAGALGDDMAVFIQSDAGHTYQIPWKLDGRNKDLCEGVQNATGPAFEQNPKQERFPTLRSQWNSGRLSQRLALRSGKPVVVAAESEDIGRHQDLPYKWRADFDKKTFHCDGEGCSDWSLDKVLRNIGQEAVGGYRMVTGTRLLTADAP